MKLQQIQHETILDPSGNGFLPGFAPYVASEVVSSSQLGIRLKVPQP